MRPNVIDDYSGDECVKVIVKVGIRKFLNIIGVKRYDKVLKEILFELFDALVLYLKKLVVYALSDKTVIDVDVNYLFGCHRGTDTVVVQRASIGL